MALLGWEDAVAGLHAGPRVVVGGVRARAAPGVDLRWAAEAACPGCPAGEGVCAYLRAHVCTLLGGNGRGKVCVLSWGVGTIVSLLAESDTWHSKPFRDKS